VATAENRPGGGAAVTLTLPVEERTAAPEGTPIGPGGERASETSMAVANGTSKDRVAEPVPER
jgi:hypothetical protein